MNEYYIKIRLVAFERAIEQLSEEYGIDLLTAKQWNELINSNYFRDIEHKIFFELIVKECIEISLKSSYRTDDMGSIIVKHIKEHFGV